MSKIIKFFAGIIDFGTTVLKSVNVETLTENPAAMPKGRIWFDGTRLKCGNGTDTPVELGAAGESSPAGSTGELQFTGTGGVFASSSALVFNSANTRVGVGTGEPNANVHIKGTTDDGTTVVLLIQDSAGDQILRIASDGKITTSVNSAFQFPRLSADPATATNGDVYYNTTSNKFRGYEAGAWANLI